MITAPPAIGTPGALRAYQNVDSGALPAVGEGGEGFSGLLSRALGGIVDAANPDLEWNRWFSMLPPSGDYGTQKLFLFRKS